MKKIISLMLALYIKSIMGFWGFGVLVELIFQIFLRIFLEILVVVDDREIEVLIIEVQI